MTDDEYMAKRVDAWPYEFTEDWFSHNLPSWKEYLLPLRGEPIRCLEIGAYEGRSALWLADNILDDPDAELHCVDGWEPRGYVAGAEQRFDANLARCQRRSQIVKHKGLSELLLPQRFQPETFDFAYIDGNHEASGTMVDWVNVRRVIKPGGLVCIDDYEWTDPCNQVHVKPKPAIDAIVEFWNHEIELLCKNYQVWVRIKP